MRSYCDPEQRETNQASKHVYNFSALRNAWQENTRRRTNAIRVIFRRLESSQLLLADAYLLLTEAALSFENGAFLATVVMCRAAAETGIYLLMSRKPSEYNGQPAISVDYSLVRERFATLSKEAYLRRFIDHSLMKVLQRLRRTGNLAVHFGSTADKIMQVSDSLGWLVEEQDAEKSLRDTVRVLNALAPKFPIHGGFFKVSLES